MRSSASSAVDYCDYERPRRDYDHHDIALYGASADQHHEGSDHDLHDHDSDDDDSHDDDDAADDDAADIRSPSWRRCRGGRQPCGLLDEVLGLHLHE
jgi:hypothetical protein